MSGTGSPGPGVKSMAACEESAGKESPSLGPCVWMESTCQPASCLEHREGILKGNPRLCRELGCLEAGQVLCRLETGGMEPVPSAATVWQGAKRRILAARPSRAPQEVSAEKNQFKRAECVYRSQKLTCDEARVKLGAPKRPAVESEPTWLPAQRLNDARDGDKSSFRQQTCRYPHLFPFQLPP